MKLKWALWVALSALVFTLVLAPGVSAEGLLDKNLHYFQPTIDGSGLISTYGSEPLGMFRMYYGLFVDDAVNMLEYENFEGDQVELIENQLGLNLVLGIGLWERINIGLAIPYLPHRSFDEDYLDNNEYPPAERQGMDVSKVAGPKLFDDATMSADEDTKTNTFEDLRLDIKLIGMNRLVTCLGVGIITTVAFPVMYKPNQYSSDGGLTVAPRLFLDLGRGWWTIVVNGGYKYYAEKSRVQLPPYSQEINHSNPGDLRTEDEIILGAGMKFRFSFGDEIVLDSSARTYAAAPFGNSEVDYAEVMAAYRKTFRGLNFTAITMGMGAGVTEGMGSPLVRFFLGFARDEKRLHMVYN